MRGSTKIRDVAKAAGVAVGTVSRVLNGHPTVTEPIRRKVQAAIDAMGYERDTIAQSMRGGATRLVACAIRDFDIPRFATFIKEAEHLLREQGYTLLLSSTTNRPEVELDLLRAFARRKVDGVMMTISDEAHPGVLEALAAAPMPVLLIDRDRIDTADRVTADHSAGAARATRHLLALGHRRIALLVGDTKAFPARSRVQGFAEAFDAAGLAPDPALLRDRVLTAEDTFRETMALMRLTPPPTAIFVATMDLLEGSLRALRALGCRVGEDVSLIAGSDSDLAELYTPPVTAVAWDLAEMGRHAATMLLERMRGQAPAGFRCLKLPTRLVIRESCRPPGSAVPQ
ncbi:LacI family transcriptional regulator [Humitalea rosea]|uniref:LacI family transcriptional regulator n=1 Tax=Humitalea rosea TaxID=990373 RepID=A0A2W7ILD0_9PROT|nr:LacI family DNA-binding transcriptional regulator [Humitalea rosea]PZW39353.1 LacI family transcriptional regulator [Humitalea rosea]